jgi:hypothetical protein
MSFVIATVIGIVGVLATRDWLVMEGAAWRGGRAALARNFSVLEIEAGAGWDGYHVYDYAREHGLNRSDPGGPSWVHLWNLPISPVAEIASEVPSGRCPLERWTYSLIYAGERTILLDTDCPVPP